MSDGDAVVQSPDRLVICEAGRRGGGQRGRRVRKEGFLSWLHEQVEQAKEGKGKDRIIPRIGERRDRSAAN